MAGFVDHLQLLPMPFKDGVRQVDGDHRPGGLGLASLSDVLERRGWTARIEDLGFDKPMPESRLAEAFARAIGDGVESAWERRRFPVVLSRAGYSALGVIDALGTATGVVWASARADYEERRLLRRPPLSRSSLALLTGRAERDKLAVRPARAVPSRVVGLGIGRGDRAALEADGIRVLDPDREEDLAAAVTETDAEGWYLHVDCSVLDPASVPGADDRGGGTVDPDRLGEVLGTVFGRAGLRALGIVGYDLNDDPGDTTLTTLCGLVEAAARAAGGVPRPETANEAGG
jgi:arginase family enzyme